MKRKFYLTFLMAIVMMMMFPLKMAAEESTEPTQQVGYAVFNSADGTLTFKYGVKPEAGADGETLYDLNEGTNAPGWFGNFSSITKVVFDSSFSQARPTTCYKWFVGCSNLISIVGIENLNTSDVTVMCSMFEGGSKLTSLDLSNFDTSNVKDMYQMFYNCSKLSSLDLSSFNTSNVTNMRGMFANCSELSFLDLSSFNTSNVKDMFGMFSGCAGLSSLDLSSFNTSNVTNVGGMFSGCSGFSFLDLSSFETSNVSEMSSIFDNCSGLISLDLSSFDTSNVTQMIGMFYRCSNLTTIYVSDKFSTVMVENSDVMFSGCTSLVGAIACDGTNYIDKTFANYVDGYFKTYYTQNGGKTELYGSANYISDVKAYNISIPLNFTDGDIVTNVPLYVFDGISYTRTMTNEWGTLCLPFDVIYSRNESYKLYSLTEATADALTFTEWEDASEISAGTPMAIKKISDTGDNKVTISGSSVFVKTSLSNPASESEWRLVGTYRTADVPDEGYVISQNAFWNVKGLKEEGQNIKRVRVNGYRAYIMPPTAASEAPAGAARMLSIIAPDEEPSSIDDINAVFSGEATYYDLNGRRIDSLQQGVNIVKIGNRTKKVIIK